MRRDGTIDNAGLLAALRAPGGDVNGNSRWLIVAALVLGAVALGVGWRAHTAAERGLGSAKFHRFELSRQIDDLETLRDRVARLDRELDRRIKALRAGIDQLHSRIGRLTDAIEAIGNSVPGRHHAPAILEESRRLAP